MKIQQTCGIFECSVMYKSSNRPILERIDLKILTPLILSSMDENFYRKTCEFFSG